MHTKVTDMADRYDCTITNVDGTVAILIKMVLGAEYNHLDHIIIQLKNSYRHLNDAKNWPSKYTTLDPLTAKLFNLNFHPLEVVSR